jgi:hypothetical protein
MVSLSEVAKAWDNFFFREESTLGIAVFRILWVFLLLVYYFLDLQNLSDFYGEEALISLTTLKTQTPKWFSFLFKFFGVAPAFLYAMMTVYGISLFTSLIGYRTKCSLIIVLVCMTTLHQRHIWFLSSAELLMRVTTFLMIFTPCGHSLSIDSLRSGRKEMAPVWGQRLLQIQLSVVYLWTVWHKLKGETWYDGTAVYYATRIDSLKNFTLPFIMDSIVFLKFSTWATLIIEGALGSLIWFRECRKWLIGMGIFFHLGIEYLMSIPFFEWLMIVLLLNFVRSEEFQNCLTTMVILINNRFLKVRKLFQRSI